MINMLIMVMVKVVEWINEILLPSRIVHYVGTMVWYIHYILLMMMTQLRDNNSDHDSDDDTDGCFVLIRA